jgi:hypothetical protein
VGLDMLYAMGDLVRAVLRLFAVGALLGGVVFMHHTMTVPPAASSAAAATQDHRAGARAHLDVVPASPVDESMATDRGADSHSHDLLHLCLAVLASAAIMLLGWLLGSRVQLAWSSHARLQEHRVRILRPPRRPSGTTLLLSLCVMRT